jgi:hypothetical protein
MIGIGLGKYITTNVVESFYELFKGFSQLTTCISYDSFLH